MVPAYFLSSPYFGTSQFLWDASLYFVDSLLDTLTAVVFPLSLLYSKYTTGTYNIIHGDLANALNRIEDFCKNQSNQPSDYPVEENGIEDSARFELLDY